MAFYIKPPGGNEKLHKLAIFSKKRLIFLLEVLGCNSSTDFCKLLECPETIDDAECLIEGTIKDRVSHFLLRLACSQNAEMTSFFIKAETELFRYRFTSMNSTELVHLLEKTYRFLTLLSRSQYKTKKICKVEPLNNYCKSVSNLLTVLQEIVHEGSTLEEIVTDYQDGSTSVCIKVPFQCALPLVAQRSVVLERGLADIPASDILKVLTFLFEQIISGGMVDARNCICSIVASDDRMRDLFVEIQQLYRARNGMLGTEVQFTDDPVTNDNIDGLSLCFPLCAQHLHLVLRKQHRLRHFSRLQYTLFLKEIGLPVIEAVKFWQREYSQPATYDNQKVGCTHNWGQHGRKYTYSIRHLYGLEGSRINYRGRSCNSIMERSIGHGEEGGCPFRHFDRAHLVQVMTHAGITSEADKEEIANIAQQGNSLRACKTFLGKSVQLNAGKVSARRSESKLMSKFADEKDFCQLLSSDNDHTLGEHSMKGIQTERASNDEKLMVAKLDSNECMQSARPKCLVSAGSPTESDFGDDKMFKTDHTKSSPKIVDLTNKSNRTGSSNSKGEVLLADFNCKQGGKFANNNPLSFSGSLSNEVTVGNCIEDEHGIQKATMLKNIQIQKPLDYLRTYIKLLGSLLKTERE